MQRADADVVEAAGRGGPDRIGGIIDCAAEQQLRSELPAALAVASCAPRGGAIALRHCGKALTRDPALWAEAVRTSGAEALLTPAAQAAPRAAFEASRAALGCLCLALLRLDRSDALEVLQRGGPCSCGRRGSKSCFDGDEELALAALASGHRMEDFFWDTLGDDFWEAHGARWSAVKWPEVQESDAFRRYALRSFLSDIAIVRSVVSPLLLGQLFRRTPIDRREAMRAEYMENPLLHALRLVVQNQKLIVSVSAGLNGVFVPLQRMTGVSTSIGSLVGLNSTLRHFLRQWTEYVGKDDVVEWIASEMGYHRADSMLAHLGEYPF